MTRMIVPVEEPELDELEPYDECEWLVEPTTMTGPLLRLLELELELERERQLEPEER